MRGIGFLVERGEPLFRRIFCGKAGTPAAERAAGAALAVSVSAFTFAFFYAAIALALRFGRLPAHADKTAAANNAIPRGS